MPGFASEHTRQLVEQITKLHSPRCLQREFIREKISISIQMIIVSPHQ
jgi:hypothetical protein